MKSFPNRLKLANLPTRIEKLHRFSQQLGIDVYVKRDDMTGTEWSGNKIRKLEFSVHEALDLGADTLITCGGLQSNHCRATAAVAARLDLHSCLLLRTEDNAPPLDGNYLLDRLLGAKIRFISQEDYRTRRGEVLQELAEEAARAGHKAYIIPEGASNGIGTFGYLSCMQEIAEQEREMGITFDTMVNAVGSGGTLAGLVLANRLYKLGKRVVGINVCDDAHFFQHRVSEIVSEAAAYLEEPLSVQPQEVEILDGYVGRGYALSQNEELDFIRDFAQLEGLVLDPVYTGKCMYGFANEVRKGSFRNSKNVLFIHTGGLLGLFPVRDQFEW